LNRITWDRPSLPLFAFPFSLFAVGLSAALLGAETFPQLEHGRTINTMAIALLLAIPAIFLIAFGLDNSISANLWRLFWSFSLVAYLIHIGYALAYMDKIYYLTGDGLFKAFIARYGWFVATFNVVLTIWWVCDVVLAWFAERRFWVDVQRILLGIAFVIAAIVATTPADQRKLQVLAILLAITFVLALVLRLALRHFGRAFHSPT
jgi:hypothetical protein